MKAICVLLLGLVLVGAGCETQPSGDREFIPGQGWMPVNLETRAKGCYSQ